MCTIDGIVSYGQKCGFSALGLVDRNVLSGAMSFKKACESAGIKPVFGLECDFELDGRSFPIVLYAKDDEGYRNLMGLSSLICTGEDKRINKEILDRYKGHNIVCLLSDDMPLTHAYDVGGNLVEAMDRQKLCFGEYIVGMMDHDLAMNRNRDKELRKTLDAYGIRCLALSRTFYLEKNDDENYEVLKCIRDKKTIDDSDIKLDSGRYFRTKEEYESLYISDELAYGDELASICNAKLEYSTSLPLYENRSNASSKDYLVSLCREGLKRRLKGNVPENYRKRLEYELKVIIDMHFEDYFLVVYDFILFAKKRNILVGPGRGSAAGSLVSYCLGITDIDPLKYGLIFERFLNPERISMPDIDTDFPDDRRDEVIAYVKERYGIEHVGHIITYGTLKAKQVLRDVGRVLNYQSREIDGLCKLIPNAIDASLEKAYREVPLFAQKIESDERYRRLYAIARRLEFFPRHESTHAAGIVMSRKPLTEVVPLIRIEDDIYSTQYTMEHLEELGLIKMDFLGLRNLGIIAEIVEDINRDQNFSLKDIPLDDKKTFELIDSVNVSGVFQLESSGMRNLIRKMKPRNFEEIGMTIALFRPGPMKNIPLFLENRANPGKVVYLHQSLKAILEDTYGIIVYQEQIMDIARTMAGFSYGKADILRKAMSKKKAKELERLHPDFIDGCLKNGYTKELSEKVYDLIMEFANYGFNKSHSIAYAMVAYQLAYLKANYPMYFYKALLNGVIGSQAKTYEYISECQKIRQKVKGISLNHSGLLYGLEDDAIIMPLSLCKDVGSISCRKIIDERESNGPYADYIEAVSRLVNCSVEKNVIENLIYAGAFDEFGKSRHTMIASLPNVLRYADAHKGEKLALDGFNDAPILEELKDDNLVSAENEKEVLGFYFTFNPLVSIKEKNGINTRTLDELSNAFGYVEGFGLINRVKSLKTKKGDMMAFVDLVDEKGNLSLAVMPNVYAIYQKELVKGKYVYFEGKMEKEASCLVRKMKVL